MVAETASHVSTVNKFLGPLGIGKKFRSGDREFAVSGENERHADDSSLVIGLRRLGDQFNHQALELTPSSLFDHQARIVGLGGPHGGFQIPNDLNKLG